MNSARYTMRMSLNMNKLNRIIQNEYICNKITHHSKQYLSCIYVPSMNYSSRNKIVKGKKYILLSQFRGFPKESDVKIVEEELLPLKDGQFLCQSLYISVDPYQRAYYQKVGDAVLGSQLARIVDSKSSKYPVGKYLIANYGWKTHHVMSESEATPKLSFPLIVVPETLMSFPLSYLLGVLGMPGVTANFGFLEICQPKPGETVVITGAAGAVGSIVGQIAKIKGCKAIGIVGSDAKGDWITKDLGFDSYVNYKNDNFARTLKERAPKGVDCYFDNVGGEISSRILQQMNQYGRISVCGAISAYNSTNISEAQAPIVQGSMVLNQLKMEGFHVTRWTPSKWQEAIAQNAKWIEEGKLKPRETITKGFENTFKAFTDMLKGVNFGKAVVEL